MKKFGTRLLAAVMMSSLIVTPVMAAPSVDDLEKNKAAAESEVSSLQTQLTNIMSKIDELESSLITKGEEVIQATKDLEAAEKKEKQQYEDMKLRIKYMYEQGDTSAIEALVTADNFSELVNQAEYVQNVHTYDRDKLEEYVETKQEVATLKTTLEDEQKNLETMQTEYEAKETEVNELITSKQAEVADLDEQIQAAAEEAARKAAEEEAARQAAANRGNSGSSGSSSSGSNKKPSTSTGGSYVASGNTSTASRIVSAAYTQLGVPYVWGGTTAGSGLDCSGLTQYAHRVAGISIGRTSGAQGGGGQAVSNPQPGDIVCYPSHVGIYIGGGQMIHAPHTGDVVRVASVYGSPWYRRYW